MKHLRILYLIDDLWSSRGGSEQHLLWLLDTIPSPEFEKHFVIFSLCRTQSDLVAARNPLILGEMFGAGRKTWWKRLRYLVKYIRENEIDLIQAFSPMGELVAVLAVRMARRGKVIGNRRDCGYNRQAKLRWIFWLARILGTRYIANSEAARQAAFRNNKTPLESITVIRNPISRRRIDEGLNNPLKREDLPVPKTSDDERIVGMVATVRSIKDYETLIRAAKIVLVKHPETWFLCVGEQQPKHLAELKEIAATLNVEDRFCWYGGIDNPTKIAPLFDVAVLSTHSESFSNAVLEYAAAKRPIVVSDVGGLGEIVEDGRSGFLVPPENPEVLAEKILRFLDEPEIGRQFGHAAREFVFRQYDEKIILKQYLAFYRSFFPTPTTIDTAVADTVENGSRSKNTPP